MFHVSLHRSGFASEGAFVYTIEEVSAVVTAFQAKYGMGASDCGAFHGEVRCGGSTKLAYVVSYNGRVWKDTDGDGLYNVVAYDPADEE